MKTLAIYPGLFNPLTKFHQNIIEKAERVFGSENVIVALNINSDKYKKLSEVDFKELINNRVNIIKKQLLTTKVEYYIDFIVDYIKEKEKDGYNIVVVRGLRSGYNFDYEYNNLRYSWDFIPNLNVVHFFADPAYMHISSEYCKKIEKIKTGSSYRYLAKR